MKKTITLALSTSFLLGFAASAMAFHETMATDKQGVVAKEGVRITLDGNVRMRGRMFSDTTKDAHAASHYDGRVQLGTKIDASPKVSGYVQLETGDGSSDVYAWGAGNSGGLNAGGFKQKDSATCKNNDTNGNGVVDAGENPTCTVNDGATDLSIVQAWINLKFGDIFGTKVGHVPLALGNKTFFDHSTSGDDAIIVYADPTPDTHVGVLTIKFEEGVNGSNKDDVDGYVAVLTQKAGAVKFGANLTHLNAGGSFGFADMSVYNLGVDFGGKFGPATVGVDGQFQFGDWVGGTNSVSAGGYCVRAEAGMAAGPAKIGLILGYGSGDDAATSDEIEGFVNFLADVKYETLIVGYTISPATKMNNDRLANMLLVQANAGVKITDDLSASATVTYMDLNEVPAGMESDIGIEIDAFLNWTIGNGLTYGIEAGYLLAGDAWKTTSNPDPEDAYYLRHTINLNF